MTIQNPAHHRQGTRKGLVQLDHVGHAHIREGGLHLFSGDAIVTDEEVDIIHVLRVLAPHHFRKDEVNRVRSVEFQPSRFRSQDRDDVLGPVGSEEDEIFRKEVGDVKTLRLEELIGTLHRKPKLTTRIESLGLTELKDRINVLSRSMLRLRTIESEANGPSSVENQRNGLGEFVVQGLQDLRGIVRIYVHAAVPALGRIHCMTVSRPFLVYPVIATKRVMWGSRSGRGHSNSGISASKSNQNEFSGSTCRPRLAI